jgi:hypothetical protein
LYEIHIEVYNPKKDMADHGENSCTTQLSFEMFLWSAFKKKHRKVIGNNLK